MQTEIVDRQQTEALENVELRWRVHRIPFRPTVRKMDVNSSVDLELSSQSIPSFSVTRIQLVVDL